MRSVIFQLVIIVVLGVASVKFRIRLLFSVVCLKTIFTLLNWVTKTFFLKLYNSQYNFKRE